MKNTLQTHPSTAQILFGWCYFFAQQLPIPLLLDHIFQAIDPPNYHVWINFTFFCLNFVVVIVVFHNYLAASLRQMGKHFSHVFGNCVAGFLLYISASVSVSAIIDLLFPTFSNANDAYIQTLANDQFWVMFVGTVLLAPLAEEVLFRGVVFGSLYKLNKPMAYILSTLLFGFVHIINYLFTDGYTWMEATASMLQYLPAGICLAWVYANTNTIFAPILVHVTANLIAILAMR